MKPCPNQGSDFAQIRAVSCFGLSITSGFQNNNSPLLSPCKSVRERAISRGREVWQFEEGHEGNVETKGRSTAEISTYLIHTASDRCMQPQRAFHSSVTIMYCSYRSALVGYLFTHLNSVIASSQTWSCKLH